MKTCIKCGDSEPSAVFYKDSTRPSGFHPYCGKCRYTGSAAWRKANASNLRTSTKKWRDNHPGYSRAINIKHSYGMTMSEYEEALNAQSGRCAVCRTDESGGRSKHFHIDHDHETGKFRGLLCHGCNTGTNLTDSPDLLVRKIIYLAAHGTKPSPEILKTLNDQL